MSKLDIVLSEKFSTQDGDELSSTLSEHLAIGDTNRLFRKSADPSLTSLIQLIGDATAWLLLSAPAMVYLTVLAKHAGDASWDWLRSRFKSDDLKPLAAVATQLAITANKVDGNVEIILSVNVPDDHLGTSITIRAREPEDIARSLAAFLVRVEKISTVMQVEIDAGRAPFAGADIELQDDGTLLIKWRGRTDRKEHERRII